ncbi:MAG: hypothetical protein IPG97_07460 [Microthrixaceae bacterium]|jgi:ABC-type Zn2+ transport system substrate-binding protein/surface adhesin|nr:hypothetical protein [Microthrixaceae bacterium]
MASGHDDHAHDDHGHGHDDHGHDDHGHHDDHGDHGSGGDAWVLPPIVVGIIIAIAVIAYLGLGNDAAPFVH